MIIVLLASKRPDTVVVRQASKSPGTVVVRLASKRPDMVVILLASKRSNKVVVQLASKRPDTVVVRLASKYPDTVVVQLAFSSHGYHPARVSKQTLSHPDSRSDPICGSELSSGLREHILGLFTCLIRHWYIQVL